VRILVAATHHAGADLGPPGVGSIRTVAERRGGRGMFKDTPTWASFSVDDLETAKDFYGTTLGISLDEYMPGFMATLKLAGGSYNVNIFLKQHHVPATYAILNFQVDDIAQTMEDLARKGVTFEHYSGDEDIFTDEKGVAEAGGIKVSWFKDPAGNLLQLIEMPAS
jgi:predicted enzyme related to lactoylglutathione lyase